MTEFYRFASDSPILTFFLAYLVLKYGFKLIRQSLRSLTIMLHGYPPMWCNVDGDYPPREKPTAGKDGQ